MSGEQLFRWLFLAFMMSMALLAIILISTVVIPREEDHLIRKFGVEYRDYMERTNRLLPRLDKFG